MCGYVDFTVDATIRLRGASVSVTNANCPYVEGDLEMYVLEDFQDLHETFLW